MTEPELTEVEWNALRSLARYGSAEDCRSGLAECAAYELLAIKGLVHRNRDETWISVTGQELLAKHDNAPLDQPTGHHR